jgi:uncharacterized protein (UPF0332 family)/predicted nucleotidyltransferase
MSSEKKLKNQETDQDPMSKLPKDVQQKLKKTKAKLDKLQKELLKKFDKYIVGISLLPPPKPKEGEKPDLDRMNILVLVDDSDSKTMSKLELKDKLSKVIETTSKEIDKNIVPQTIILSELWQSCYDAKYDLLQLVAMSAPIFDKGILKTVKVTELHKSMVLKKFEKYIVSYVVAGSVMKGYAKDTSDIDVYVIIDDTDVKKMSRAELKDKLRAIIIGMGIEAGEMTGVRNKLHVQVYILTDFWDSLRESNPVIFTLLRDCIPLYDRGIFMPWKQLLEMGRIKPSSEAIDMFMSTGEQMLKRVKFKLRDIGMEDIFLAILTPTQAALMLYGLPPPAPKECGQVLTDVFVKKEKLLETKFVKIYETAHKLRKDIEHGLRKEVTGKEIDDLLKDAESYLKRIERLFTQIEKMKSEENVLHTHETILTIIRDVLNLEGMDKIADDDVQKAFKTELIEKGRIPAKYERVFSDILEAKKKYESKKLTKNDLEQMKLKAHEFTKVLVEYMQRKRGRALDRAKVRIKHGDNFGEVLLLGDVAFIIHDIDVEEKEISKASIKKDGGLEEIKKSSLEELEKSLATVDIPPKAFIKEPLFEDLRKIFGKGIEILVNV